MLLMIILSILSPLHFAIAEKRHIGLDQIINSYKLSPEEKARFLHHIHQNSNGKQNINATTAGNEVFTKIMNITASQTVTNLKVNHGEKLTILPGARLAIDASKNSNNTSSLSTSTTQSTIIIHGSITINPGGTLIIDSGVNLIIASDGALTNYGVIQTDQGGTLTNLGTIVNSNVITNNGAFVNGGTINLNEENLLPANYINNYGAFSNTNFIQLANNVITNNAGGTLDNTGIMEDDGFFLGIINNAGIMTNENTITSVGIDVGVASATTINVMSGGAVTNTNTVVIGGALNVASGGLVTNTGFFSPTQGDNDIAFLNNGGNINNIAGTLGGADMIFTNSGDIKNFGTVFASNECFPIPNVFTNNEGAIIDNFDLIQVDGCGAGLTNNGIIDNECNALNQFDGVIFSGNPPVSLPCTIAILAVSNSNPRWNLDQVSVSGAATNNPSDGDTVTINWGDGTITTGFAITGPNWGPVSHIYPASAVNSNPNQLVATLVTSSSAVQATSAPSPINVQPHKTSLSLASHVSKPWDRPVSFTATLTDTDNGGTPVAGEIIHFTGTGVIGVSDPTTNGNGIAIGTGTTPSTVESGWTYQAHFAGDLLYLSSDSAIKTYNTIRHQTLLTLSMTPNPVIHGMQYSVSGKLRDTTSNLALAGKTITFTTDNPSVTIPSTTTAPTGKYFMEGLVAPNVSLGSIVHITAKYAGDTLYIAQSITKSLTIN